MEYLVSDLSDQIAFHFAPIGCEDTRYEAFQKLDEYASEDFAKYLNELIDFAFGDDVNLCGAAALEIRRQIGEATTCSIVNQINEAKWKSVSKESTAEMYAKVWRCVEKCDSNSESVCVGLKVITSIIQVTDPSLWIDELIAKAKSGQKVAFNVIEIIAKRQPSKLSQSFVEDFCIAFGTVFRTPQQTENSEELNCLYLAVVKCYSCIIESFQLPEALLRNMCQSLVSKKALIICNTEVRIASIDMLKKALCAEKVGEFIHFWKDLLQDGLLCQLHAISNNFEVDSAIKSFFNVFDSK